MYLYQTTIYHDTTNVIGVPSSNTTDVSDFETNHKASALAVTGVNVAETTFVIEQDYQNFASVVETNTTWASVKYVENDSAYKLYLLSANSL